MIFQKPGYYKILPVLLGWIFLFHSFSLRAQSKPDPVLITENFQQIPLLEVVRYLRNKYGLQIAFEKKQLANIEVNTRIHEKSLPEAFSIILTGSNLETVWVNDRKLVIRPGKVPETEFAVNSAGQPPDSKLTCSGTILDPETGESIPYAIIKLPQGRGVAANQDGFFSFTYSGNPVDSVEIHHLGYQPKKYSLQLLTRPGVTLNLLPAYAYLEEVEVNEQAQVKLELNGKAGQTVINPQMSEQLPQVGLSDVFRNLQMLPGISIADETSAGLHVRGGLPDQNLVLFDGFTIYHLDHLYGFFSSINEAAIKDFRIYKGGFGASYGGRVSSVIDITGKAGNRNKISGQVGLNLLSTDLSLESPVGKHTSIFLSLRRSYYDLLQTGLSEKLLNFAAQNLPDLEEGTLREVRDTNPNRFLFYDLNGKVTSWISPADKLSLSYYHGLDRYLENNLTEISTLRRSYQETVVENYQLSNNGVGINWDRLWNKKLYGHLSLGYSAFQKEYDFSFSSVIRENQVSVFRNLDLQRLNNLQEWTVTSDFELSAGASHQFNFGFFVVGNQIEYTDRTSLGETSRFLGDQGLQAGFYLEDVMHPLQGLEVTAGVRNTWFDLAGKMFLEPRLALQYEIADGFYLKGATGKYHQFISKAQTNLPFSFNQDFWVLHNDNEIPVSSAVHWLAGFSHTGSKISIDLEFYHKKMEGLLQADYNNSLQGSDIRSQWDFNRLITDGNGFSRGMDLLVSTDFPRFNTAFGYSLSEVKQRFAEINQGQYFYADLDQRHEIKWTQFADLSNWNITLNNIYGTGRPFSEPTGVGFRDGRINLIYLKKNNQRLPTYFRTDLSVSNDLRLGKSLLTTGISIFNLLNRVNTGSTSFYFNRDNLFRNRLSRETLQQRIIPVNNYLLDRTFSIFTRIRF